MMRVLVSLVSGLIFGTGLVISDMINPARVLAFLDLFGGQWDPTLAFVMGGALLPMAFAWWLTGRGQPLFGELYPGRPSGIDVRLLGGASLFGLGWGLVGFCPGPALSAAGIGGWPVWLFLGAMVLGIGLQRSLFSGPRVRTI